MCARRIFVGGQSISQSMFHFMPVHSDVKINKCVETACFVCCCLRLLLPGSDDSHLVDQASVLVLSFQGDPRKSS